MNVEFYPETDMQRAVGDVEAAVNALTTLPKESERPIISQKLFRTGCIDPYLRAV